MAVGSHQAPDHEQSPLLNGTLRSSNAGNDTFEDENAFSGGDKDKYKTRMVLAEFLILLKSSAPIILAYALQNSMQAISILIVGRSSATNLSIAAFSYMFAMATGWLIALGGTTALDTLCSSAFTGSSNPHDLGVLLQRAFIILAAFYVPVAIIWAAAEPLFLALGQEPEIAAGSARFLWVLLPGGLGYIYFESVKKYLQAQGYMRAGTYVLLITAPLNALLNYTLIYPLNLGLLGAPLATGISYWSSFALLVAYCRFVGGSACWGGWDLSRACGSRCTRRELTLFARLAALGVFHVGTEWWAFETITLVAGSLGQLPLAAQSIIATSDQVMNTIPFGVGVATSARVGNLLGSKDARGAARAAHTAAVLSMLLGGVVLTVLMASRNVFGRLFTDDEDVVALTARVLPLVALFQIADGLNGSCGGALRGMGRQHVGAAANLLSYYGGALPAGIALALNGWGLTGLWLGNCVALYLTGFAQWAIVGWSNWEHQVRKAFSRMNAEGEQATGGAVGDAENPSQ